MTERREFDGRCIPLGELDETVREDIKEIVLNGYLIFVCVYEILLSVTLMF